MLSTMSHLGPFELGQIKAHLYHGLSGAEIARILKKPDGKSEWKKQAIYNAIDKLAEILHGGGSGRKDLEHLGKQQRRKTRLWRGML